MSSVKYAWITEPMNGATFDSSDGNEGLLGGGQCQVCAFVGGVDK